MPVEPILAVLAAAVVVNLVIMAIVLGPTIVGRHGPSAGLRGARDDLPDAVELATLAGGGGLDQLADVPAYAYERVVRIAAWVYLLTVAAVVTASGLWPTTQPLIVALLVLAGLFVVVVHDLLPAAALGPGRFVIEASAAITFASLLVLLTGQERSPFFFTFPLIVAGAALVVTPGVTVALALFAAAGYVLAVVVPIGGPAIDAAGVATVGIDLATLMLLAYVAMVIAREQRRSREAAVRASTIDALTGLFNRTFLYAAVEREIARSSRSGRGFCLLMLDLDDLKTVNDRYGHHLGDRLLSSVGGVIRNGVRRIDTPARYGGDEFAVLCPETDPTGAFVLAEKIRLGIRELTLETGATSTHPSVSIGVVTFPHDGSNADGLFMSADRAMYGSKRAGKDRVMGLDHVGVHDAALVRSAREGKPTRSV
ncbi:MAG TPA: GGDEF domain-containing protein [Candidatus Dormibacteraeota bacterium]|nr:GGDEF domain-containing protein [Candidatus Dormibacteraeota bacterium]